MSRRTVALLAAVAGAAALLAVFVATGRGGLGAVLAVLWAAGWLYRFWELR